ncbi:cytochrome P450 [Pendulispora rubella]|uniref:Cytochrome P450 n=1 Tax=Pendulispora rubella TaxID=2741070 RepID=A0ABZ2L089_9BACT
MKNPMMQTKAFSHPSNAVSSGPTCPFPHAADGMTQTPDAVARAAGVAPSAYGTRRPVRKEGGLVRRAINAGSYLGILALKPLKIYAYRTRFTFIKRAILEVTTPIDWSLIFLNIQNPTMLLHEKAYGGNFLFGKGVMVIDHRQTEEEIAKPAPRCNDFMGVSFATSDSITFATNTASVNQCPPARSVTRDYIETKIFKPEVRAIELDYGKIRADCAEILSEWKRADDMATMFGIRGAATRILLKVLSGKTIPKKEADEVTHEYIRRFLEASLFSRYATFMNGLLGTHESMRRNVYQRLRDDGFDGILIEMVMFAGMFSVGSIVMRCVEDIQRFEIRYDELTYEEKRNFVIEAQRLFPTVTTVHRILEKDEVVKIGRKPIKLQVGDQIVYPFACSNRDPSQFHDPEMLRLDRPREEYDKVLSWSKGPHGCPARDLSITVVVNMLDTLAERYDLSELKIFNMQI